jgi:hypothetical protein
VAWLVAVALVVLAVGGWGVYHAVRPAPPAVDRVSDSRPARDARQLAGEEVAREFNQLVMQAPWLAPIGTAVTDSCTQHRALAVRGSRAARPWSRVTCSRDTVVYAAFNGTRAARVAQLDKALRTLGWTVDGAVHPLADGADGTARLDVPHQSSGDLAIAQRPLPPHPDSVALTADGTLPKLPASAGPDVRTAYPDWPGLSPAIAAKAAYAKKRYGFTLAFHVQAPYYTAPASASS